MKFIKYFALSLVLLLTNVSLSEAQVQVSMPDTSGTKPDTMLIPIRVSDLTGQNVYSAEFTIDYNPNVVQALGLQRSGTLSANWPQPATHFTSGQVRMAFADQAVLEGSGVFIYLQFRLLPDASPDSTALNFSHVLLNEGDPAATTTNGKIKIRAIHISPQQGTLFEGDTLQFSVSGTVTPPVTWSLTNSSVAEITSGGEFHALQRGFTKVIATDDAGLADTTDNIVIESVHLRDLTLTIPDTSYTQTLTFDLPVYISNVNNLGIYSGQFTVNFNSYDLRALGVSTTGTMTESWGEPAVEIHQGSLDLAIAGTTALSDSGIFVYVQFQVRRNASGSSTISISDALFNEDILANTVNGHFSVISAPNVQISPDNIELTNGDTQQFSATGGTGPYTWGTTNNGVATVDQSGFLTTHSSGSVRVFTQDAENFVDTTNVITVNDLKVSLMDTTVQQGAGVSIPITVDRDLSPFDIYSFEFSIAYSNSQYFTIDTTISSGTLSAGWGNIAIHDTAGVVTVAAAGSTPLAGSGILLNIVLTDTSGAPLGTVSNLAFQHLMFNEGTPTATLMNGSATVSQPPVDVHVFLPDTSTTAGSSLDLALTTPDTFDTLNVTSYEFVLLFDSNILASTSVNSVGTMSDGYTMTASLIEPGMLQVTANGSSPLSGTGDLLVLHFEVLPEATGSTALEFNSFQFNSGNPNAITHNGNVTINPSPPSPPELASPPNAANDISIEPTLFWHPSARTDSYQVQVSTVSDFSSTVFDQSGIADTSQQIGSLTMGTTYYWHVNATNTTGTSAYSATWQFSTANNPPVAVNDTVTINEDTPTVIAVLQNDYDPDGDALTITGVDTSNTLGHVAIDLGDTTISYTPPTNFSGIDTFSYSISDGHSGSDQAMVRIIVNPVNDPPSSFSLLSPPDSTQITITNDNLDQTVTFQWETAEDVDSDTVTYGFVVESGNLDIIAFADTGATSVTMSYQTLVNLMRDGSTEQVMGHWTILATDGQDTTYATNGPWYLFIDATTVNIADEPGLPQTYALEQNYPNPFNPTTTIQYAIPEATHVTIAVYNILGERVATLLNKQQEAGRYSLVWNGRNTEGLKVSTGLYFYRIKTEHFTAMKKMVLAK